MSEEDSVSHRERERRDAALAEDKDQDGHAPTEDDELRQQEEEDAANLSKEEEVDVEERRAPPAKIVHEVIRRQGIEELERPAISLFWSGLAAGVVMGTSILGEALLSSAIPQGKSHDMLASFGYTLGFLIVIMGRLQLFTESTVTAIIPLATKPSLSSLIRTLRLWGIVLAANILGTFAFALFAHFGGFGSDVGGHILEISHKLLDRTPRDTFLTAIPSGFLIASLVWMLPSASGQRIWIIIMITWTIALGGFAHIIAGSGEAWTLMVAGEMPFGDVLLHFLGPALIGNVVGGTALFAVLAHAQVHKEIHS